MKIVVLASGSKGNVTYVEEKGTRILIDIGKSCSYIEKKLKEIDVDPSSINAILITHTHNDHVMGIKTFYNKYKPTIYLMPKMMLALCEFIKDFDHCFFEKETIIDNLKIRVIKTSHDVVSSVGFLINDKFVYITDTGYLNERYFPVLSNKSVYVIESNHDIEMLYNGSYPYHLKRRIASDTGHLSNIDASKYLSKMIGPNTKHIILAHLSEENNSKKIALKTLSEIVKITDDIDITVAEQNERTQVIEV